MAMSPNVTLVSGGLNADGVNGVWTYDVVTPDGLTVSATFGTCTQVHAENLASCLADGGYVACQAAGHMQTPDVPFA